MGCPVRHIPSIPGMTLNPPALTAKVVFPLPPSPLLPPPFLPSFSSSLPFFLLSSLHFFFNSTIYWRLPLCQSQRGAAVLKKSKVRAVSGVCDVVRKLEEVHRQNHSTRLLFPNMPECVSCTHQDTVITFWYSCNIALECQSFHPISLNFSMLLRGHMVLLLSLCLIQSFLSLCLLGLFF